MTGTASKTGRADHAKVQEVAATVEGKTANQIDVTRGNAATEERGGTSLPPPLQDHIGRKLQAAYKELVEQPVPDEIMDVFKKLQAMERGDAKE